MRKAQWSVVSGRLSVACFVLSLCLCACVAADDFGDLRIQIEALSPGTREHGYAEYRATLINRSSTKQHRVTLELPADLWGISGNTLRSVTRTVEVAPNATVTVSLYCPALSLQGTDVAVLIDGVAQPKGINVPEMQVTEGRYEYDGHVLISPAVKQSGVLLQAEKTLTHFSGEKRFDFEALELGLNEWSNNWLGYSSYDGIIVTGAELRSAPEPVRTALLQYVECGGTLLVFGDWEIPSHWRDTRRETTWQQTYTPAPSPTPWVDPAATPTPTPAPTPTPEPITVRENLQQYEIGFGIVMIVGEQAQQGMTPAQWHAARSHWGDTRQTFRNDVNGWNVVNGDNFAVVEGVTTPVRGMFLLMLLFVLLIGPLNLWLLSRWRKRLWLLWTVPAISLLTCLAVGGYAILREGFQGYERTEVFTVLDEKSRRATTIGYTGFYAPLTPGEGLRFSTATELSPITTNAYYFSRQGSSRRSMDWTNDQHLTSGWVTARTPAHILVRKSETRRERLTITANADRTFTVVNGLGAPLAQVWFADQDGNLHEGKNLEAGASVKLQASGAKLLDVGKEPLRMHFGQSWLTAIREVQDAPGKNLKPGHYLAVLESAPFLESGLANVRTRKAKTVVYGIPAQP